MTRDELKIILEKHKKWFCGENGGEKANLRGANLSFANLSFANLSSANLRFANLSSANLRFANLSSADLRSANLNFADLSSTNLSSANLSSANLRFANLSSANLSSANLHSADLCSANLTFANLSSANLIVIHPGPWMMIITKTHVHVGCEQFPNNQAAKKTMERLAKKHKAPTFLPLYREALVAARKLMKLSFKVARD